MKKERLIAMGAASVLLLGAVATSAQDAVEVQPENNKVLFENDRVRVLDVKFAPGTTLKMHSHPDHVVVFVESAKAKMTSAGGQATEMENKKGEARWVDGTAHTVENTGTTPAHAIVVELKDAAK